MLDADDFKETDAGLVREEMMKLCCDIWVNRSENNSQVSGNKDLQETNKVRVDSHSDNDSNTSPVDTQSNEIKEQHKIIGECIDKDIPFAKKYLKNKEKEK
jgi:hypothetical protein